MIVRVTVETVTNLLIATQKNSTGVINKFFVPGMCDVMVFEHLVLFLERKSLILHRGQTARSNLRAIG